MDDETEDHDLQLQRAYGKAIPAIKSHLYSLVSSEWASSAERNGLLPRRQETAKQICALINQFQDEPQLLDPHLNEIASTLNSRAVGVLESARNPDAAVDDISLLNALGKVFYTLCKVRGEKVVSRFLGNEAKLIDPLLEVFREHGVNTETSESLQASGTSSTSLETSQNAEAEAYPALEWECIYHLTLWLSHLMLSPFGLATVSSVLPTRILKDIQLPTHLPVAAMEGLEIGFQFITAATKQQHSASVLLTRLCLRPDMRSIGLLKSVVQWALSILSDPDEQTTLHTFHGALMVLSRLIAAANARDMSQYFSRIYSTIHLAFDSTMTPNSLRTSAIAKRLAIKVQRNIVLQLLVLKDDESQDAQEVFESMFGAMSVLEEVIDFLLRALADRESQVRLASSKALSVIASRLESNLSEEVVEAIIGSLGEDVLTERDGTEDTSTVDPLRWHGLTLTLSHMLFRRSPSTRQLESVLTSLYRALSFEQRSSTGISVGANVRDAANFGLWSLARRYTTFELQNAYQKNPSTTNQAFSAQSVLQRTACYLVLAACFDPAGNVRRGSSAALQELIGRHPDTILEGIHLVQTVEYQAVGLRRRAMVEVAFKTAQLETLYRDMLLEALFDWRGIGSPDAISRDLAATAIGQLSRLIDIQTRIKLVETVINKLERLPKREFEWRHGLVKTLAALLFQIEREASEANRDDRPTFSNASHLTIDRISFPHLWSLFGSCLSITRQDLNTMSYRPELTVAADLALISTLASCNLLYQNMDPQTNQKLAPHHLEHAVVVLILCLEHVEDSSFNLVPASCSGIQLLLPSDQRLMLVQSCMQKISTSSAMRFPGLLLALGSLWRNSTFDELSKQVVACDLQREILNLLKRQVTADAIEIRAIAVRSLSLVLASSSSGKIKIDPITDILTSFNDALNDYTINERGDVGSLVRLEALTALGRARLTHGHGYDQVLSLCFEAVQRLALEKLDKVRLEAAKTLQSHGLVKSLVLKSITDVSTREYFVAISASIINPQSAVLRARNLQERCVTLLAGLAFSACTGSAVTTQARSALHAMLSEAPQPALLGAANALLALLQQGLARERLSLPLLELTCFLLDAQILQKACTQESEHNAAAPFKWRTLLSLVQKAHYKSSSMPKILAAIDIYRGLAYAGTDPGSSDTHPATGAAQLLAMRPDVHKKLIELCGHPFPRVRIAAAEALWCTTQDEELKPRHWTAPGGSNSGSGGVGVRRSAAAPQDAADGAARAFLSALRRRHVDGLLDI